MPRPQSREFYVLNAANFGEKKGGSDANFSISDFLIYYELHLKTHSSLGLDNNGNYFRLPVTAIAFLFLTLTQGRDRATASNTIKKAATKVPRVLESVCSTVFPILTTKS